LAESVAKDTRVLAPAFTCAVVHEAVARSGAQLTVLDAAADDFLVQPATLSPPEARNWGVVLCELYGHAYELAGPSAVADTAAVRVIDMALSVPHPSLFKRLRENDFAVISFGKGKTMYAGWGAMGFTGDRALADAVRRRRDAITTRSNAKLGLRRTVNVFLRTAAHYPTVYSLARKLRERVPASKHREIPMNQPVYALLNDRSMSAEWRLPLTHSDRALALWNVQRATDMWHTRLALASRYEANLRNSKNISLPKPSASALSHYTIRLNSEIRSAVKDRLFHGGVHTVTLWAFSQHLEKEQYPNALRLSNEVLNLPLSPWMTRSQVDQVCEALIRAVEDIKRDSSAAG
jgi:dTDP-4-amino-4,6-dideoxygalactose transaminase